ncbi:unnamed protein product [Meloidogyne enterolobii]|uniref:Uncharacterized protein n=1 Tax=Meloidogyne enterolobii TaxID=390850 RepID=A0ACB1AE44_MELEN
MLLLLNNFCLFLTTIIFFTFSTISLCCRKKRKLNKAPTSKQTRADVRNENTRFFKSKKPSFNLKIKFFLFFEEWPEEHVNPDKVGYDTLSGINKEEVFPIRTERDYQQKLPPTKSLATSKSSIWIATRSYYGDEEEEKTKNDNHSTYIKKEQSPKTRLGKKKKKKTKENKKEEKLAKIKKKRRKDKD